jgi:thiol-disulfide isomerase/thioredoxin
MQRKLSIAALVGLFAMGAPLLARTLVLPEFSGVTHWLNTSKPVDRASLKGKVVLVDFWTYSCINCIRSVPHLKQLYEKYHGQGLEIIGVHTPEFHFEKDVNNVQAAIQKFGIPYPVAMDDNYQMWDAFASRSWPSVYLTDREGVIRYRHFGEGNEAEVEKQIQELLSQNNPAFKPLAPTAVEPVVDFSRKFILAPCGWPRWEILKQCIRKRLSPLRRQRRCAKIRCISMDRGGWKKSTRSWIRQKVVC